MILYFSTRFRREYRRLPSKIQQQTDERLRMFKASQFHPLLNNHLLGGEYKGCRSINVTGDYRAIFEIRAEDYIFIRIGTHSELYGK